MAALSRGCQPNKAFKIWSPYPLALFTNCHFNVHVLVFVLVFFYKYEGNYF